MRRSIIAPALALVALAAVPTLDSRSAEAASRMPDESAPHEATWLQWPHQHTYGRAYRDALEPTWVAMADALAASEKVRIIAYNKRHRRRIERVLRTAGIDLADVAFVLRKTDDTWVRDNGPIFVHDKKGGVRVTDWGFNGWGLDAPYRRDDRVPAAVARSLGLPRTRLDLVLEGGAIEVDGRGTLMATRSSILEPDRNPGWTQDAVENVLARQLGIDRFLWLDGAPGGQADITDTHIDGFARFADARTIVTMRRGDLRYWALSDRDVDRLYAARDVEGAPYTFVYLPLTQRDVVTAYGRNLGYKGSYVNFYTANTVVLVPAYGDPNDAVARDALARIFPDREVVGIDVRNLYREGGMVHCVTQQQPARQD